MISDATHNKEDFSAALCQIRGIVSTQDLAPYDDLNNRFSCAAKE